MQRYQQLELLSDWLLADQIQRLYLKGWRPLGSKRLT